MGVNHLHKRQRGQWLGISVILLLALVPDYLHAQLSGLDHERDLNYAEAVVQYRLEIKETEARVGEYDLSLFEPLLGLARSLSKIGDFEAATEAARRAQHISHRHEGVHTPRQLEVVELLTRLHLATDEPLLADAQQRFAYYIKQTDVPADSIERLPAMESLAKWYEKTGQLHRARKLNEQGLEIIEAHFGEDAIEQLPYLQRLAKLKRLQRVCCSTRIMAQALDLVESNPNISDEVKAKTYLEIADTHTIAGNRQEASTFYRRAWELMSVEDRSKQLSKPRKISFSRPLETTTSMQMRTYRIERDAFGRREYKPLQDDELRNLESLPPQEFILNTESSEYDVRIRDRTLSTSRDMKPAVKTVGHPYTFLREQFFQILPSRMHSDAALDGIVVELEFDIDSTGKPFNVEVLTENTPTKVSKLMRDVIRKSRFRPRMEDGYPVATQSYRLTQSFSTKTTTKTESI